MQASDTLITYGGPVKALDNGRIGGYLVKFSGPDDPDLYGDFFAADTDFDIEWDGGEVKSAVYWDHGFDPFLKLTKLGDFTMKKDAIGIWVEGQLEARDKYEEYLDDKFGSAKSLLKAIREKIVAPGKCGLSSGTAGHLVEREPVKNAEGQITAYKITRWPLKLDASLTPTPAEPRTSITPLKSYKGTPIKAMLNTKINYSEAIGRVCSAFRALFDPDYERNAWVTEVHSDAIIAYVDTAYFLIPYTDTDEGISFAGREEWTQVEERREWVPAKSRYEAEKAAYVEKQQEAKGAGAAANEQKPDAQEAEPQQTDKGQPVKAAAETKDEANGADDSPHVQEDTAPAKGANHQQEQKQPTTMEENKATEQVAAPESKGVDIDAVARKAAEEAVKAYAEGKTVKATRPIGAPAIIESQGDTEAKSLVRWLRNGDVGGVKHLIGENEAGQQIITLGADPGTNEVSTAYKNWKASNATDMNVGTDADGGYAVPEGHLNQIIARRDETMIAGAIGCRLIPGVGTTVNVPLDAEDDGEFVETAEAANSDLDAPAMGQKAFTLKVYSKYLDLSYELLRDETSGVLNYISDFVGRGMAKTHNNLLVTEVGANGTSFKTFASATAIGAGELEAIEGNDNLGAYLDDSSVAWLMRNSTLAAIRSITGDPRLYADDAVGAPNVRDRRQLVGYDVYRTNKAAAIGASAKSVYFGNWNFVGYRAPDGLQFLRDPFSVAIKRQVRLHYYFSTVYGVLQSEAIGYGAHPTG